MIYWRVSSSPGGAWSCLRPWSCFWYSICSTLCVKLMSVLCEKEDRSADGHMCFERTRPIRPSHTLAENSRLGSLLRKDRVESSCLVLSCRVGSGWACLCLSIWIKLISSYSLAFDHDSTLNSMIAFWRLNKGYGPSDNRRFKWCAYEVLTYGRLLASKDIDKVLCIIAVWRSTRAL